MLLKIFLFYSADPRVVPQAADQGSTQSRVRHPAACCLCAPMTPDVFNLTPPRGQHVDRRDPPGVICPVNTRRSANAGLMLVHRLGRWPNINPTLV